MAKTKRVPKEPTRLYRFIKSNADKHGVSISEVARNTDLNRMTFDHWRRKEPKGLKAFLDIIEYFQSLEHAASHVSGESV